MDFEGWAIAASLAALSSVLALLSARGFLRFARERDSHQVLWAVGLGFGAAATVLELVAYLGFVTVWLLQAYVFFSAAIVGVLSLGSVRAFRRPRLARAYGAYTGAAIALVALVTFATPLSTSMVVGGVIARNPPVLLLVLSSLVTVPATVVLLGACVLSLRRAFRWKGLLLLAGASVLGAGGAFYLAAFPVMLYYAEFVGILLLFLGLVDLSRFALASPLGSAGSRTKAS